jgi:hypothetical protein
MVSDEQYKKDMAELKFENRVQTLAVLVLFFFGVSQLSDLKNKLK